MLDLQSLINSLAEDSCKERSKNQVTLGDLIDKLKKADDSLSLSPKIKGIGAYRGYYSDIALCTEYGSCAYKTALDYNICCDWSEWNKKNKIDIEFLGTPKELAKKLESLIGLYFDGYKGGFNEITRDKPLWIASDYGNCSDLAIIDITDDLEIIAKEID